MPGTQGLFQAEDGTSIFYEVQGEGPPLVFCYGLLCQRDHWRHQIDFFSSRYQIITFDYRGHQRSSTPVDLRNLTVDWCARDLIGLIRHLGLNPVAALGHSLGVAVLCRALTLAPELFAGSVWTCGAVSNPFAHMFHTSWMDPVHRILDRLYRLLPRVSSGLWKEFTKPSGLGYWLTRKYGFHPLLADPKDVEMYVRGVNETPPDVFFNLVRDYSRFDGRSVLKTIQCPVLVVAGDADSITPFSVQEKMVFQLLHGTLVRIPRGSHNAHMDLPDTVNREIDQFFTRIGYS